MQPQILEKVLSSILANASAEDVEVSLEANPIDVNATSVVDWLRAGVNRLSLGVQTFDDQRLAALNRDHRSEDAVRALESALCHLPRDRVSADLIFGLPGQTLADWRRDLDMLSEFDSGHTSVYELTLERGTDLWKKVNAGSPDHQPAGEDLMADMYEETVAKLAERGLYRYESSNFASGLAAECRHNAAIWEGGEYVGVGPGAHGRFKARQCDGGPNPGRASAARLARIQTLEPNAWMAEVASVGHGTRRSLALSEDEVLSELIVTSMRTKRGLTPASVNAIAPNLPFLPLEAIPHCSQLIEDGLVVAGGDGSIRPTDKGLAMADRVAFHVVLAFQDLCKKRDLKTDQKCV